MAPSPLDSAACYASSVDPLPPTQHRGEAHTSTSRAPNKAGMTTFLANRLRALVRPRILLLVVACSALLLYRHAHLLSYPNNPHRPQDNLDSRDPRYRPLVALPPPPSPFPNLQPNNIPIHCLESWFLDGATDCGKDELGEERVDATWTWVNGSDRRWRSEMEYWRTQEGTYSPEQHFRDFNELLYSMRSVLRALQGHLRTFHLVVYDFAFDAEHDAARMPGSLPSSSTGDSLRVAQTPTWLDFSRLNSTEGPNLQYAVHSEIFHLPTPGASNEAVSEWRTKALPSYNSMAIESRLAWLPGLAETSIALNDDFFILRPHSVADFTSALYGNVFRFDKNYYQQPKPVLSKKLFNDAGETSGLVHANHYLSNRFPRRRRPYVLHGPRVMSRTMLDEASIMFADVLKTSSARRFRELKHSPDIHIMWLMTALKVERWREAFLWTYVVANLGAEGVWGTSAREAIKDFFDIRDGEDIEGIQVMRGERWTTNRMRVDKTFHQMGWRPPVRVKYLFSSMDGHLPPIVEPGRAANSTDMCDFELTRCLGPFWSDHLDIPSQDMFKRLAFEESQCGDCLIMALVSASGYLGLSAIFPPQDATYTRPRGTPPSVVPHLPLTPTWQEADFSLASVMANSALPGKVNLRHYTMRLLARYLYVSGATDAQFKGLENPKQTNETLREIDRLKNTAVLGLNDNVEDGEGEVKAILGGWFERRWPKPAPWERTVG